MAAVDLPELKRHALEAQADDVYYEVAPTVFLALIAELEQLRAGEPPIYPDTVDGQRVMQPAPLVMVDVEPSGYAMRLFRGASLQPARPGSRVVKYALAPPEAVKL